MRAVLLAAVALLAFPTIAPAQDFPNRVVKFVVPVVLPGFEMPVIRGTCWPT